MDYLNGPTGPIAIPPQHTEGSYCENLAVQWAGDAVSLYFWAPSLPGADDDGRKGEVVAHVVVARSLWLKLPGLLTAMEDRRQQTRGGDADPT